MEESDRKVVTIRYPYHFQIKILSIMAEDLKNPREYSGNFTPSIIHLNAMRLKFEDLAGPLLLTTDGDPHFDTHHLIDGTIKHENPYLVGIIQTSFFYTSLGQKFKKRLKARKIKMITRKYEIADYVKQNIPFETVMQNISGMDRKFISNQNLFEFGELLVGETTLVLSQDSNIEYLFSYLLDNFSEVYFEKETRDPSYNLWDELLMCFKECCNDGIRFLTDDRYKNYTFEERNYIYDDDLIIPINNVQELQSKIVEIMEEDVKNETKYSEKFSILSLNSMVYKNYPLLLTTDGTPYFVYGYYFDGSIDDSNPYLIGLIQTKFLNSSLGKKLMRKLQERNIKVIARKFEMTERTKNYDIDDNPRVYFNGISDIDRMFTLNQHIFATPIESWYVAHKRIVIDRSSNFKKLYSELLGKYSEICFEKEKSTDYLHNVWEEILNCFEEVFQEEN